MENPKKIEKTENPIKTDVNWVFLQDKEDNLESPTKRRKLETFNFEEDEIETLSNVSEEIEEYELENEQYRIDNNLFGDGDELDENEREWEYADSEDDLNYGYESNNDNYDN